MLGQRETEFGGEFLHRQVFAEDFGAHAAVTLLAGAGDQFFHQQSADALPLQAVGNQDAEFAAFVIIGIVGGGGQRGVVAGGEQQRKFAAIVETAQAQSWAGGRLPLRCIKRR